MQSTDKEPNVSLENIIEDISSLYGKNIKSDEEFARFEGFVNLKGASTDEIAAFEKELNISLPEDMKQYYELKNGSRNFQILQMTPTSTSIWDRFHVLTLNVLLRLLGLY